MNFGNYQKKMKEDKNKFFEKTTIKVDENQTAIRLDVFLFDKMPNVTRNKIQEGIKSGHVSVNKNKVKPSYKVKPGDLIKVEILKPIKPT